MEQKVFDSMLKSGEFEQMFNENKINELLSVGNLSKKQVDQLIELGKKLSKNELKKRQLELSKQPGYKEHILVPLIQKILAEQGRIRDPKTGRYVKKTQQSSEEMDQEDEYLEDSGDEQDTPEDSEKPKTGRLSEKIKKIAGKFVPKKMKDMFSGPKSNTAQAITSKVNTELYTKVGTSERPRLRKRDNAATVAAKLYSILRNDIEEKKLTKELKNNFREGRIDNEKRRHDEIMEALGYTGAGQSGGTGKSDEEIASSGATALLSVLGLGAVGAGIAAMSGLGGSTPPSAPSPAAAGAPAASPAPAAPAAGAPAASPAPAAPAAAASGSSAGSGFTTSGVTRWSFVQAGADPSTYTFSGNSGQNKTNLGGETIPEQKNAPALDMSKKKDGALPDLVLVFDNQSGSQRLVSEADIKKGKGRYLRVEPTATARAAAAVKSETRQKTKSEKELEDMDKASEASERSYELIIEQRQKDRVIPPSVLAPAARDVATASKVTEIPLQEPIKLPNGARVTKEVYDTLVSKGVPIISNVRTEREQLNLIAKTDEKGRSYTTLGKPVAKNSKHFTGDAIDVNPSEMTEKFAKILEENGWFQPLPKTDSNHWERRKKNSKAVLPAPKEEVVVPKPKDKVGFNTPDITSPETVPSTLLASNDYNSLSSPKDKVGFNTPDITSPETVPSTLLASNDYNSLSSNDVMTGLLLKQISSLNMDQKKVNKMQPIVLVNNSTNMIGSSRKETIVTPTHPDYNAYSPYA